MKTTDILSRSNIEHIDLKVIEALMKGHIISCKQGEFRYATKDQELYKEQENSDGDRVYIAIFPGLFQKMYSFDSSDKLEIENASGFKWVHYSDSLNDIINLISSMDKEEKLQIVSAMAFDNVVLGGLSR